MTAEEISNLATEWISYWHAPIDSSQRLAFGAATDHAFDLIYDDPETLWLLILAIHRKDQSVAIQQVLSAGPMEDLLAEHGDVFIDRVEVEARRDPSFAKVLGGVWQNSMSDEVWKRLQAVWDRTGWDDVPE